MNNAWVHIRIRRTKLSMMGIHENKCKEQRLKEGHFCNGTQCTRNIVALEIRDFFFNCKEEMYLN